MLPRKPPPFDEPASQSSSNPRHVDTSGGDYAENDIDKRQGTFYETHHHYSDPRSRASDTDALDPRLRTELLTALDNRYAQRLDDSLEARARIALDLRTLPAAVAPQYRLHLYGPTHSRALPPGTPIAQVFDEANGELLILGDPGAGKTTLLLELARVLISRALTDAAHPIPVVVNLASWAQKAQPLERWLPDAIHEAAGVSKHRAKRLLNGQHLLLLLDGLDEVAEGKRAACIAAINTYCAAQRPLHIAVCSRKLEYEQAGTHLGLELSVGIDPLTLPQIEAALADIPKATHVLVALGDDPLLRELLTTPLMLNITLLAYAEQPLPQVPASTLEERRTVLFTSYVRRMFQQRRATAYTPRQIMRGLHWLAAKMQQDAMTDFLLWRMQPGWLPNLLTYRIISGLVVGLVIALVIWLSGARTVWLLIGLFVGLVVAKDTTIRLAERLTWSWHNAWLEIRQWLVTGPVVGLVLGSASVLTGEVPLEFFERILIIIILTVIFTIVSVFGFGVVNALNAALVVGELETTIKANQGIVESVRNGMLRWLVTGLASGVLLVPTFEVVALFFDIPSFSVLSALLGGLLLSVIFGLLFGLSGGLGAFLRHYLLRFLLTRAGLLPWDAVGFLDTACALLFLQRDGGIYRFRHMLLRDYFASLTPEEIAELVRGLEEVRI